METVDSTYIFILLWSDQLLLPTEIMAIFSINLNMFYLFLFP